MRGFLVGIEGIDGSGKSMLAQGLALALAELKLDVTLTKEPGGTSFGKQLRQILQYPSGPLDTKAEFLLFAADRAQHYTELVLPALQRGQVVISDRTKDSALVYQGYGRGLEFGMLQQINQWVTAGYETDLVIYLRIDAAESRRRIWQRAEQQTVFEQQAVDFTQKLIEGFERLYQNHPRVLILDGKLPSATLVEMARLKIVSDLVERGILQC